MSDKNPKEAFYDENIHPLMERIISMCKEAKINMVADFSLGEDPNNNYEPMFCTTCLTSVDPDDVVGVDRMRRALNVLRPRSDFMAITIFGGGGE